MASKYAVFDPFEAEFLDHSLAPANPEGRPSNPTPKHFQAPALWLIAVRAGFRPDVKVHVGHQVRGRHCPFKDEVLRLSGFNPDDESSLPFTLWGSTSEALYEQIFRAVEERTMRWHENHPSDTLPLYREADTGGVSLTEYGVAAATKLHDAFNTPQVKKDCHGNVMIDPRTGDALVERRFGNVTAVWLDAQCQEGLVETMVERLMHDSQLGPEQATGLLLDHVQDYMLKVIRCDSFRSWLERGDAPRIGQLCEWAKRKACSTFRKRSRDVHGRHRFGARTEKERAEGGPLTATLQVSPYTVAITGKDTDETPLETNRVIVDPVTAQIMEHTVHGEIGMQRVREAIRRRKSRNPDRFVALFDLMVAGHTVAEIGEEMGVSRNRAANLMAALRTAIREAEAEGREARLIIRYLKTEPFGTIEDIREDIKGLESDVPRLMSELVAHGRLKEVGGSYLVTDAGEKLLPQPEADDFGARLSL